MEKTVETGAQRSRRGRVGSPIGRNRHGCSSRRCDELKTSTSKPGVRNLLRPAKRVRCGQWRIGCLLETKPPLSKANNRGSHRRNCGLPVWISALMYLHQTPDPAVLSLADKLGRSPSVSHVNARHGGATHSYPTAVWFTDCRARNCFLRLGIDKRVSGDGEGGGRDAT